MANILELQGVIASSETLAAEKELSVRVNNPTLAVSIDPFAIFCAKTGAKIGIREKNSILEAIKMRGKIAIAEAIFSSHGLEVHPAWVKTDNKALDELQFKDPIGYACFCFNLLTARFYEDPRIINGHAERYWSLARAHALLSQFGDDAWDDLCAHLCHLLTYTPDTFRYLSRLVGRSAQSSEQLALLACSGELIPAIKKAIDAAMTSLGHADYAIKRKRFEDIPNTPSEMAKGPSNIRMQKTSRRKLQKDEINHAYSALTDILAPLNQAARDERARMNGFTGEKRPVEINLNELASIEIDEFADPDDWDEDDTVVVRRISRREIPSEIQKRIELGEQKPKSGLLQTIRAQSQAKTETITQTKTQSAFSLLKAKLQGN